MNPKNLAARQVGVDLRDQQLGSPELVRESGTLAPRGLHGCEDDREFLVREGVESGAVAGSYRATLRLHREVRRAQQTLRDLPKWMNRPI